VEIEIAARGGRMTVEISNEGHALEAADLPRLFDRFTRKDVARAATGIHAGLGLSICRRLTELQDARVEIRLAGPRFVAWVELPLGVREAQRL
jgi:signal transduction histidine kinase